MHCMHYMQLLTCMQVTTICINAAKQQLGVLKQNGRGAGYLQRNFAMSTCMAGRVPDENVIDPQ